MLKFVKNFCSKVLNIFLLLTMFLGISSSLLGNVNEIQNTQESILENSKELNPIQVFLNSLKSEDRNKLLDGQKEATFVNLFDRIMNQIKTEEEKLKEIDKNFLNLCDLVRNQEIAKEELKKILSDTVSTLNTLIEDSKFVADSGKQITNKIEILSKFLRFLINQKDLNLGSLEKEFQDILDRLSSLAANVIDIEKENIVANQNNQELTEEVNQNNMIAEEEKLNENNNVEEVEELENENNVGFNQNNLEEKQQTIERKRKSKRFGPKLKRGLKKTGKFAERGIKNVRGITPGGVFPNIISNILHHRDEIIGKKSIKF